MQHPTYDRLRQAHHRLNQQLHQALLRHSHHRQKNNPRLLRTGLWNIATTRMQSNFAPGND
eukprot:9043116-Pyramimonas_sp.AAC.2